MAPTTTRRPNLDLPPTPAPSGDCSGGNLTLYSRTYHRGARLELSQSQSDPTVQQFGQTAVSALLAGSCCWDLYAGANYSGQRISLRPGLEYTSVTSLGDLFRSVASVRKVQC